MSNRRRGVGDEVRGVMGGQIMDVLDGLLSYCWELYLSNPFCAGARAINIGFGR